MTTFMTYKEERDALRQQLADTETQRVNWMMQCKRQGDNAQAVINELRQQLAEKDEEIARLKASWQSAAIEDMAKQLAASQAREVQLREALQELVELMEDTRCGDYKPDSFTCQPAFEALAIPQDTTALDALIRDAKNEQQESDYRQFNALCRKYVSKAGEVMRERCADKCTDPYYTSDGFGITGADRRCAEAIRALPCVTLEDLQK